MIVTAYTQEEIRAAVRASGEFDSVTTQNAGRWGDVTGHLCASCGEFEEDGGDANYDGTSAIPVLSESLQRCKTPDCECCAHPHCLIDGLCPCCVTLGDVGCARDLMRVVGNLSLEQAFGHLASATRRSNGEPE